MGLNRHSLNIFLELEKLTGYKVDFSKIATIGRQGIHEKEDFLNRFLKNKKRTIPVEKINYCEGFFKSLGNKILDSVDFSDFENANIIHDLNDEIDFNYHNKYDLVVDGGSLEHIFDFKTAISNCMNMVKEGGFFVGIFPVNNFPNHGFYQFSPELFFRCFSESNGFQKGKLFLYQEKRRLNLYEIKDSYDLSRRLQFKSMEYTMGFFISKKLKRKELFQEKVLQSDYKIRWTNQKLTKSVHFKSKLIQSLKRIIPKPIKNLLLRTYEHYSLIFKGYGIIDKKGFRKIL